MPPSFQAVAVDSVADKLTSLCAIHRSKTVYQYMADRNIGLIDCRGQNARRSYVVPRIIDPNVKYITGTAHGLPDLYSGSNGSFLFQVSQNASNEVEGKIIHFMACKTARNLGPDLVSKGCWAFFGYWDDFMFPPGPPGDISVVLDCDAEIDRAFADRLTAQQVMQRVRDYYKMQISMAGGNAALVGYLQYNYNILRSPALGLTWGDPQARLS